jgi:molecular chaperone DnaK
MKEYGDKLSDGNKNAINGALDKLKEAHKNQDITAIDTAMAALNGAWQAASQEMYQATNAGAGADANAGAGAAGGNGSTDTNNVSDVEFEEVNDKK